MVLLEMIELWHDCIYTLGNSDLVVHVAMIGDRSIFMRFKWLVLVHLRYVSLVILVL